MKRIFAILMAAICLLTLAACGDKKPSLEEVEQAISEGNVTVEDALEKGWVTEEWAEDYYEKNTVSAADKSKAYSLGEFSTKTVSGEAYTSGDLSDVMYFAFFDPSHEGAEEAFKKLCEANDAVEENGGKILVFSMSETETELFADAPFPVLVYNESVGKALPEGTDEFIKEVLAELPFTSNWYANGYFQTAWYSEVNTEELAKIAKGLSTGSMNEEGGNDDGQAAVMMG